MSAFLTPVIYVIAAYLETARDRRKMSEITRLPETEEESRLDDDEVQGFDMEVLQANSSRWKIQPQTQQFMNRSQLGNRYNLLLYIRGLENGRDDEVQSRIFEGLRNTSDISVDYEVGMNGRVTAHVLRGNNEANTLVREMDALILLARKVWPDPNITVDWIRELFLKHYRRRIVNRESKRVTLERAVAWGDKWAEVRYRFLNHYLRDDPDHWQTMSGQQYRDAGDRANAIIHSSAIEEDCLLAESLWFTEEHRALFVNSYRLSIKEARRLHRLANWIELHKGIRSIFSWTIDYINRFIDWRETVLRASTREHLRVNPPSSAVYTRQRNEHSAVVRRDLGPADQAYIAFLESVRGFLNEATVNWRLRTASWRRFTSRIENLRMAVRNSIMNPRGNRGPSEHRDPRRNWPRRYGMERFPFEPPTPPQNLMAG